MTDATDNYVESLRQIELHTIGVVYRSIRQQLARIRGETPKAGTGRTPTDRELPHDTQALLRSLNQRHDALEFELRRRGHHPELFRSRG